MGIPTSNTIILSILIVLLMGCVPSSSMPTPVAGDVERGAQLFSHGQEHAPPCSTCHQVIKGKAGFSIGPNLAGIRERAGERVVGMTPEKYLQQSILEPEGYVVAGYRNIMYPDYSTQLTEQDLQDLIAYLLTL